MFLFTSRLAHLNVYRVSAPYKWCDINTIIIIHAYVYFFDPVFIKKSLEKHFLKHIEWWEWMGTLAVYTINSNKYSKESFRCDII